jgi:hypothetical protein
VKKREIKEKTVKRVTKQVTFEPDEWDIIQEDMRKEKIDEVSLYIRRSLLLHIGKNIQGKLKL